MKLLRYGPKGQEKPGLLDSNGIIRDLSGVIDDVDAQGRVADQGQVHTREACTAAA